MDRTLLKVPGSASWPRLMSPAHPDSTGSYGKLLERHARGYGLRLRWWQRLAVHMLLQHDADGRLLVREAAVSTCRQVGKGWGVLRPLAEWRSESADLFGEPQTVMHLSNQLNNVMEIATPGFARARENGDKVKLTNGEQAIIRADGSRWLMRSTTGGYGYAASLVLLDEAWGVAPRVVDSMLLPVLVSREQSQLVMLSTANKEATPLYQGFRDAAASDPERLVLEWSPPPEAAEDPTDERWWGHLPFQDEKRLRAMRRAAEASDPVDFACNWLNVWPDRTAAVQEKALPGWAAVREHGLPDPGRGGIVCVDESWDASSIGMLVLVGDCVWYSEHAGLAETVQRLDAADIAVAGITAVDQLRLMGSAAKLLRWGKKEADQGTPLMRHIARGTRLRRDGSALALEQAEGTVVTETEGGWAISAKKSESSTLFPKLLAWALRAERQVEQSRPAIW